MSAATTTLLGSTGGTTGGVGGVGVSSVGEPTGSAIIAGAWRSNVIHGVDGCRKRYRTSLSMRARSG
jgi:hypothetical protein